MSSYNHHVRTHPGSQNSGEDYMRNFHVVNTHRASSPNNISFHGKSGSKLYLAVALGITFLLLLAAVVIIILYATGIFESTAVSDVPLNPTSFPDVYQNRIFNCELYILKQANAYYNDPNNFLALQAKKVASEAISQVMSRSSLASLDVRTELLDLTNSGEDLRMRFRIFIRVPASSPIDVIVMKNSILTPRTLSELSRLMNGVTFDTTPARIIVQLNS